MMDLPVIETNIRAALKRKPRKGLQGIGGKELGLYYHMQPRKVTGSFLLYNRADGMDNSSLTVLIHLAVGGFHRGDE